MLEFQRVQGRKVTADFGGGNISSNGGLLLISELDKKLGFTESVGASLQGFDQREQGKVKHSYTDMFRQRVYGICSGDEDLNDHDELNKDILFQTVTKRDENLASSATLSRFENQSNREMCVAIQKNLVESFIEQQQSAPPQELILDFDATDDLIHGNQGGKFFHGYYGNYCYLPLYVFCCDKLLVSYLRPSNIDGALHTGAILSLLVRRFRKEWPKVKIIFRGDGGFCRHRILNWCERHKVDYILGLTRNKVLERQSSRLLVKAEKQFNRTGESSKVFCETWYRAQSWKCKRRVICKAEFNRIGKNQRYIVTNLKGRAQQLYQQVYCARGDMENRIKEQQLGLFADRTSCQDFWANQFRLLLSSCAYVLLEALRSLALQGTQMARSQVWTIRTKLLKVGAIIRRNTRTIYINLASSFPRQDLFKAALAKINALC